MAQKYKMTGCAKFFIFFLIAAPLSYIGASYYNGVDPFVKLKNIEIFKTNSSSDDNNNTKVIKNNKENHSFQKELELKDLEIKHLTQKNKKLEDLIETQKEEISKMKLQHSK